MAVQSPISRRSPVTCSRRSGAAALEFAVIAPVFFALVLGMIEVGRGFMVCHQLASAARDGCRFGSLSGKSSSEIQARVNQALGTQGITGYTTTIEVNDEEVDASTATSSDKLTVKVEVPVGNVTWIPGGSFLTGKLGGKSTLRRE